jgi:hypothetical protein
MCINIDLCHFCSDHSDLYSKYERFIINLYGPQIM